MDYSPARKRVRKKHQITLFAGFAVGPTEQKQEDSVSVVLRHTRPAAVWSTQIAGRISPHGTEDLGRNQGE